MSGAKPEDKAKYSFLNKSAPANYVAGIGRGATGFTTRSDIGPARDPSSAAKQLAQKRRNQDQSSSKAGNNRDEEDEDALLNESNYDQFAGYGGSLVTNDPYEEDDEEADKIYAAIEKHLDERGKPRRTKLKAGTSSALQNAQQQQTSTQDERANIKQHFNDLKASLASVSESEWLSIPEVGDARNRKQRIARQDKYTPVPDSLIAHQAKLASGGDKTVYLDPLREQEDAEGEGDVDMDDVEKQMAAKARSSLILPSSFKTIGEMSEVRSSTISDKLSQAASSSSAAAAANPQDYLTNLESMVPTQITDAATLTEYRKQFASLRASNPTFTNAWVASIRLEEAAGKIKAARALALQACERNPKSVDLWCEAARLHPPDVARALMVRALKENPRQVRLWLKAAEMEPDDEARRRVFARARELVPKSAQLWRRSVELEAPDEARRILRDAVECCPDAPELWIALARLEKYEEAQRVLIRASEKLPAERAIWITAAQLEEAAGNKLLVEAIVKRAMEQLAEHKQHVARETWLADAVNAERAGFVLTCEQLVKQALGVGVASADRQAAWLEDARRFAAAGQRRCARAVYECLVGEPALKRRESIWCEYVEFERKHGDASSLEATLRAAVSPEHCAASEQLWLQLCDLCRTLKNEPAEARATLTSAIAANPLSEKLMLARVELECDAGNSKEARKLLADACMSQSKTAALVLRSAQLERAQGNLEEAARMLRDGTQQYRDAAQLYLLLGEIEEQRDRREAAKAHYSAGLKYCPTSVELWCHLALLEERTGFVARARAKFELARLRNPRVVRLWLESARFEVRVHEAKQRSGAGAAAGARPELALNLLAKGAKECAKHADVAELHAEMSKLSKRKL